MELFTTQGKPKNMNNLFYEENFKLKLSREASESLVNLKKDVLF